MFPYLLPIQTASPPQLPQLFSGSCAKFLFHRALSLDVPSAWTVLILPHGTPFTPLVFFMYLLLHKAYTDIFNHSITQFPDPALTSLEHELFNTVVALSVFCFFYQTIYSIKLGQIVPFVPIVYKHLLNKWSLNFILGLSFPCWF